MALTCLQPALQLAAQTSLVHVSSSCKAGFVERKKERELRLRRSFVFSYTFVTSRAASWTRRREATLASGERRGDHGTKREWIGECEKRIIYRVSGIYRRINCQQQFEFRYFLGAFDKQNDRNQSKYGINHNRKFKNRSRIKA